jgi:hypothetical protein
VDTSTITKLLSTPSFAKIVAAVNEILRDEELTLGLLALVTHDGLIYVNTSSSCLSQNDANVLKGAVAENIRKILTPDGEMVKVAFPSTQAS